MTAFTYGEVCAGVGGLSRGLEAAGMECRFHAEIAAFPRRVLAHHWPDTPLLSDLNAISGGRKMRAYMRRHFAGLTLLAGGTPCQDLSVAGKRAGLAGARSSLYFRFVRLWKVLDCPYLLWENVAGALSSNQGADFALVLSAIVGATVPVPSEGWPRGGVVAGPTGVAAWRLLDAQWFGVPQRRLRVFVLGARTGGVDPAEVLLEPQGVRRHPPTRREAGERVADSLTVGANQTCGFPGDDVSGDEGSSVGFHVCGDGSDYGAECRTTLRAQEHSFGGRPAAVLSFGWQNSASQGDDVRSEADASLRVGTFPAVMAFQERYYTRDNKTGGAPTSGPIDITNTHKAGDSAPVVVAFAQNQRDEVREMAVCGSLAADAGAKQQTYVVTISGEGVRHALTHEGHDASEDGTGRGTPIVVPTLTPGAHAGSYNGMDAAPIAAAILDAEVANTITAREAKGWNPASAVGNGPVSHGIPRRLMPVETERLMGWDDGWTDVPDPKTGKPASDAQRYKACGNGVVSNVAAWIASRLLAVHTAMLDESHDEQREVAA